MFQKLIISRLVAFPTVFGKVRYLSRHRNSFGLHLCCTEYDLRVAILRPCVACRHVMLTRNFAKKKVEKQVKSKEYVYKVKPKQEVPVIEVWRDMTVSELAKAANRDIDDVFEAMMYVDNCDIYDDNSSAIDSVHALHAIVKRLGCRCSEISKSSIQVQNKDVTKRPPADPNQLVKRPPVVTIMGHVDHGKTTLLDTLRHTSVVKQEFGGITQHIGAFLVKVDSGETICFLDTPGHAAFSAMRARGANATDIVVLVVAADDGVMEQTVESIKYAKTANVPIIVAINKIDKATADPDRVKEELVQHGIQVEDKGGEIQAVPISARTGDKVNDLVESIMALSEMLQVRADPKGFVEGVIIESTTDPHRGKLATVLIQRGTLRRGDYVVSGTSWAKVRAMFDERGQVMMSAPPGTPVQVIGWRDNLPSAGDLVLQVETEKRANEVMGWRKELLQKEKAEAWIPAIQLKEEEHLATYKERLKKRIADGRRTYRQKGQVLRKVYSDDDPTPHCNVIIKGDVDGSVEAILDLLETYNHHKQCHLDLVHYGVGKVTPNDLDIADTFNAIIYAFNVDVTQEAAQQPIFKQISMKRVNVIYKIADDLKEEINKRILPIEKEELIGEANVLQEFQVSERNKKVPVAGCRCVKGQLKKSALFRLKRNEEILYDGKLESMFHEKNAVESIKNDVECGLKFADKNLHFETGDLIQCYHMVPEQPTTQWNPGF